MMHLNNPFKLPRRASVYLMISQERQTCWYWETVLDEAHLGPRGFFPLRLASRTQCLHHEPQTRVSTASHELSSFLYLVKTRSIKSVNDKGPFAMRAIQENIGRWKTLARIGNEIKHINPPQGHKWETAYIWLCLYIIRKDVQQLRTDRNQQPE